MKKLHLKLVFIFLVGCFANNYAQSNNCFISGQAKIFDENIYTYQTYVVPGSWYNWTVQGDLEIVSGARTPSVRVRKKRNASSITGKVCVTRFKSLSSFCTICKEIKLGCLKEVDVVQTSGSCLGGNFTFRVDSSLEPGVIPIVNYSWSATNATIIGSKTGRYVTVRRTNFAPTFSVRAQVLACGSRLSDGKNVFCGFGDPDCGPLPCFTLSMNPGLDNGFTITQDASNFADDTSNSFDTNRLSKKPVSIQILNQTGRVVKSLKTIEVSTFIATDELPRGHYFVKITKTNGKTTVKSVVTK